MAIWDWRPSRWVGLVPNGMGAVKPNHYKDLAVHAWRNRRQLPFAWRILKDGVCDGCALGTTGMRDFTMKGPHLCTVRTGLLELNTASALDPAALANVDELRKLTSRQLRGLGRLPYPMVDPHTGAVLFPFRTTAMLAGLFTIVVVSRATARRCPSRPLEGFDGSAPES